MVPGNIALNLRCTLRYENNKMLHPEGRENLRPLNFEMVVFNSCKN